MRSKCRDFDLDHSKMEVLVVVKKVEMEVVVWMNKTSVKGEGKGSRVVRAWATHPNNIKEGGRPCLILPHQPGRSPKFSKIPGN